MKVVHLPAILSSEPFEIWQIGPGLCAQASAGHPAGIVSDLRVMDKQQAVMSLPGFSSSQPEMLLHFCCDHPFPLQ
jgi:hypothetical protein